MLGFQNFGQFLAAACYSVHPEFKQNNYISILYTVKPAHTVGCFGFNGPLRQYFSLYRAVSQREGERKEKR